MEMTQAETAAFAELNLEAPASEADSCALQKLALIASLVSVASSVGGTVSLLLSPDPTTITKWVSLATAAALVASLMSLVLAYDRVIECEQAGAVDEARQREIENLKQQQRMLQETVEKMQRAIDSK